MVMIPGLKSVQTRVVSDNGLFYELGKTNHVMVRILLLLQRILCKLMS